MFSRLFTLVCATLLVACGGGDPGTGPSPPPSPPPPPAPTAPVVTVSVTPNAVERASGNASVINWSATNAQSCSSFWGENVGTSGSYSLIPTAPISGTITCTGEGGSKSAPISISIVEPPHLRLGLVSTDGQNISGLYARLKSGSWDSTIALSGASLDVPLYESIRSRFAGDSIDVTIDRQGNGLRTFFPLVGRIGKTMALTGQNLSVVLIPSVWNISCGTHSGNQVAVSLHKAHLPLNEVYTGFFGTTWFWERFPRFVALDRPESNAPISAQDSTGMWNQIAQMESALCIDLYKPGTLEDVATDGGTRIRIDVNFPETVSANAGFGKKNLTDPYLYWGVATFKNTDMLSRAIVKHELIHTLGFGHSCQWPTVMYSFCPNPNEINRGEITAEDVAYIRLFYAVRKLEVDRSSILGLSASLRGEREIVLGLPSTVSTPNASLSFTRTTQVLFEHE